MATPIWKDYIVTIGTADSYEFTIYKGYTNAGVVIYQGKAFRRPGDTYVRVKVNDICADYVSQALTTSLGSGAISPTYEAVHASEGFSLYVEGSRVDFWAFYLNWEYADPSVDKIELSPHAPITARIQEGMMTPLSVFQQLSSSVDIRCVVAGGTVNTYTSPINPPFNVFFRAYGMGIALSRTTASSVSVYYKVIPKCHRYALYYLNKLGGLDVLVIEGKSNMKDSIDSSTYKRAYDNGNLQTRGEINYRNDITRTWELHTGWLTDAEAGRMGHLLGSPLVYLCDCDDAFQLYPVVITNKDCPYKTHKDGMVSYRIDVQLARDMIRR